MEPNFGALKTRGGMMSVTKASTPRSAFLWRLTILHIFPWLLLMELKQQMLMAVTLHMLHTSQDI